MITVTYPDLPITERRQELLSAIRDHQVVVVAGETGSGKSTQLPKLCLELGRGQTRLIGHTQPRRIAARTIAERIAEELGTTLGNLVGYTVRFTDQVGSDTRVKVMTDGILLNETHRDRLLSKYDTIIIDEAHERSLNIDFLLGYLKTILPKRPDLKVIITSATIDTERFSSHFDGAPVVEVSGRTYPVEIRYRALDDSNRDEVRDQPQGICEAVQELFTEGDGDILVFCAGEREIRDAVEALDELRLPHTEVIPMFGRLSAAEQHRVFQAHTGRRVVVATNVAETSLTVPGIRYVVDCGTARISRFSKRTKVQRLPIEDISQASAAQRAGRCGRLGPGIAIRLYSQDDLESRPEFTDPEILRTQLASVILRMAALGIGDIETFPFLDPPDARTIRDGMALLAELQAVDPRSVGSARWVTKIGRSLTRLPVDVRLARMLVEADRNGSLREVLIIVAALAIQDPRERPTGAEAKADQLHARFRDEQSDFMSWLNLWRHLGSERRSRSSNQFRKMCREEFLNYRRVREWQDVHSQLVRATEDLGMKRVRNPASHEVIHQALLTGLLSQVGTKDPESYEYRGARGVRFSISPGSTLFKRGPTWVMAGQLVETARMWARQVAGISPEEIEAAAEHLVKRSHSEPWWDPEKGAAVANESVSLYGLPLQTTRPVQFGSINPEQARDLFIRHALIVGEWDATHAFVEHNHSIMAEALELERRYQRAD
ncbi:MAG: ATP-dependent RNA helicase HrpA, partial [Acidimicrobiia bacterium]|nr:ATP-dependent RNA helicase HrpA [Acidimicrobiia bacterium]